MKINVKNILQNGVSLLLGLLVGFSALANPTGGQVTQGQANITTSGAHTQINQSSNKAIIQWHSFNIGKKESTHFQQPKGGIALNRIDPNQGFSSIYGSLTATGKIILINSSGVYFGPGAYVHVGGIIATTANITDKNFIAGNYHFINPENNSGFVINEGTIIAKNNGLIALVAPGVINNGLIKAKMGHIILASGDAFTISFSDHSLVNFKIDTETTSPAIDNNGKKMTAGVTNNGTLLANGGHILITAKTAGGILDQAINMKGIAEAKSVSKHHGEIILLAEGGTIQVGGQLNTSAKNTSGGKIHILGKKVLVTDQANINASGATGGGEILIGGDFQGKNLNILNADYTYIAKGALINADATNSGNGGKIILWSNLGTTFYGNITARGGAQAGNGGFIEVSGKDYLRFAGNVIANAPHGNTGTLLLDPTNINIINGPINSGDQDNAFTSGDLNFNSPDTANNTVSVGQLQALGDINITLQAKNKITIGASTGESAQVDLSGTLFSGILTLMAGDSTTVGGGNILFNSGSTIDTGGGSVNLIAGNVTQGTGSAVLGDINTQGGNITVTAQNGITTNGQLNSFFGLINLDGGNGAIHINQNINSMSEITATGTDVTVAANTIVDADSGLLSFNASNGAITTNSDSQLLSTGTITLIGNTINLSTLGSAQIGGDGSVANATNVILRGQNGTTIGVAGGAGTLALSEASLNTIHSTNVRIGSSQSGSITLGTFTPSTTFAQGGVLTLASADTISQTGSLRLAIGSSLLLRNANNVMLNNSNNRLNNVAATISGSMSLTNQSGNSLTVTALTDDIGTTNGIMAPGGVSLTASGSGGLLKINQNILTTNNNIILAGRGINQAGNTRINAGTGSLTLNADSNMLTTGINSSLLSTNTITLIGNNMLLNGLQIGGDGSGTSSDIASHVIFQPGSINTTIGLAGAPGTLNLTTARLNTVRATNVTIGNNQSGMIRIGTWTPSANFAKNGVLTLATANTITQTGALNLTNNNASLLLRDASSVNLTNSGNVINQLAVNINGNLSLFSSSPLTVTNLSDETGIVNGILADGISLSSSHSININQDIHSTNTISLTGVGITVSANIMANSANIFIDAGTNNLTLNALAKLLSSNTITLTSDGMTFDPTAQVGGTASGVGNAATVILQSSTAGRTIGIGGGTGNLSLSSTALNNIRTTNLRIGNNTAGNINIGTWTSSANLATNGVLTLDTAGSITQNGALNLAAGNTHLLLRDASNVSLNNSGNILNQMATNIIGSLNINSQSPLTVTTLTDDIGTVTGMTSAGMTLNSAGLLSLNQSIHSTGAVALNGVGIALAANQSINANAANINLNAGTGNLNLSSASSLFSSGTINLTADTMTFDGSAQVGGTASGIGNASTVILQSSTAGRTIGIGGGTGDLSLNSTALNDIRTTNLRIGNNTAGNINIGTWTSNAIATNGVLTLDTAGTITQSGALNLAAGNTHLLLRDASNVSLNNSGNMLNQTASNVVGSLNITSQSPLTVTTLTDDIGTVSGMTGAGITLNSVGLLSINQSIHSTGTVALNGVGIALAANQSVNASSANINLNAGTGNLNLSSASSLFSSGIINLIADTMTFDATAQIGGTASGIGNASTIILQSSTAGRTIGIGGGTGNLSLDSTALNDIRTTNLRIGNNIAGNINIGTWISNANVAMNGVLTLDTAGTITQSGALNLAAGNTHLLLRDASNISLNNSGNMLNQTASNVVGSLNVTSQSPLTVTTLTDDIGTVNGMTGSGITLNSNGLLSLNQSIHSTGNVALTGVGITLAANQSIAANSANISLNAGVGNLNLSSASSLLSSGTINLTADTMTFNSSTQIGGTANGIGKASTVILLSSTAGRTIGIGGGIGNLSLDSAALNAIRTTNLRIGNSTAGNINIGSWTSNTNVATNGVLTLDTAGTITQTGALDLSASNTNLLLRDAANVDLNATDNYLNRIASNNIQGDISITQRADQDLTIAQLTDDLGTALGMQTNGGNINLNVSGTGKIRLAASLQSNGGNINLNNNVSLLGNTFIDAGNGNIQINGNLDGNGNTLSLQNGTSATGNVTFNGDVNLQNLITFSQNYSVIFNGSNNTFTGPVIFNNLGGVTLGNGSLDTFNFNQGLTNTAGSSILNGAIHSNNAAITLGTTILNGNTTFATAGGNLTFGDINGSGLNLTLNTSALGNINFNGNSTLGILNIINAHDVNNNATMQTSSFLQNAGHLTNFGNAFSATGDATIFANSVIGAIDVGALTLNVQNANLTGTVAGLSGDAAIAQIRNLNTLFRGTHFFDGIDMAPLAPLPPVITPPNNNPIEPTTNNNNNSSLIPTIAKTQLTVQSPGEQISLTNVNISMNTSNPGLRNQITVANNQAAANANNATAKNYYFPLDYYLANNYKNAFSNNASIASINNALTNNRLVNSINPLNATINNNVIANNNGLSNFYNGLLYSLKQIDMNNTSNLMLALLLSFGLFLAVKKQREKQVTQQVETASFKLRTDLNNITGFADLMYQHSTGATAMEKEKREFLADIISDSKKLLRHVEKFSKSKFAIMKKDFMETLSFQLRTALTGIKGFTELLSQGKVAPISVVEKEYLNFILASSDDALQLANSTAR